MKTRLKILWRALTQKNVILIYSNVVKGDIHANVIVQTEFTKENDKIILQSAASKINPPDLKPRKI